MEKKLSWEIVYGDESSLPLIQSLFKAVYNQDPSLEYLRWRYLDNPIDTPLILMAHDSAKNQLAGLQIFQPAHLRIGDHIVKGAQSMDTMTRTEYRNQGIFPTLAKNGFHHLAAKSYEIVYGFPNDNSLHTCIYKLNWDYTGKIPQWVRPIVPFLLFQNRAHSKVRKEMPSAENLNAFLSALSQEKGSCTIMRSAEWLFWRYHQASGRQYHWHALYDNSGALTGFGVWAQYKGQKDGQLAEISALNPEDYSTILASIIDHAAKTKIRFLKAYAQHPDVKKYFQRSGFIPIPNRFLTLKFIVRSLAIETYPANIHHHPSWRISGGDFDVV